MNGKAISLISALCLAVMILASGCISQQTDNNEPPIEPGDNVAIEPTEPEDNAVVEDEKQLDDSLATTEGVQETVNANNEFAFDLYSKYKSDSGNVFFSPYSISTALAMTYEGAKGTTAEEMKNVFHFPESSIMKPSIARIYNELNEADANYSLKTANALWAQKEYVFLQEYFDLIGKYYGGNVTNLDFINETEKSRLTINSWIEEQTNDKIKDLIPQGSIDQMTRLVLTNAIYFKGKWATPFEKILTSEKDFKVNENEKIKAQMMQSTGKEAEFNYTENDEMQLLELPYAGEKLSMLLILPKENDLAGIEQTISNEKLSEWKNLLRNQRVDVFIPKFKFETKYFMADDLAEMGMPTAFLDDADFSGMTGKQNLKISQVIHQAFVEVNEEGTEAAAATAVIGTETSMPLNPAPIPEFRADHPFIFIIQEKETGNILFMGKVANPIKEAN